MYVGTVDFKAIHLIWTTSTLPAPTYPVKHTGKRSALQVPYWHGLSGTRPLGSLTGMGYAVLDRSGLFSRAPS
jgi:hypothetical protein